MEFIARNHQIWSMETLCDGVNGQTSPAIATRDLPGKWVYPSIHRTTDQGMDRSTLSCIAISKQTTLHPFQKAIRSGIAHRFQGCTK